MVSSFKIVNSNSFDLICDTDRVIKFIGTRLLDVFNLKSEDVIGRSVRDIMFSLQPLAEKYRALNDDLVYGGVSERNYVTVVDLPDKTIVFRNIAQPIKLIDKVIGLHVSTQIVEPFSATGAAIAFNLINTSSSIVSPQNLVKLPEINHPDYELTQVQELVLYLITLGRSDKDIAILLGDLTNDQSVSGQTISKILTRGLYPMFEVTNRRELAEKALQENVIRNIPKMLLSKYNNFKVVIPQ